MFKHYKILKITLNILLITLILLSNSIGVFAFDPSVKINIYSSSDTETRSQIDVIPVRNTNYISFYVDKYSWDRMSSSDQHKITDFSSVLSSEFEYKIYPKIVQALPNISQ